VLLARHGRYVVVVFFLLRDSILSLIVWRNDNSATIIIIL
jgi:hypothetical protein